MRIEGSIPPRDVHITTPAANLADAVRQFQDKYPGARVESVDDVPVRGMCEGCGIPLLETDTDYQYHPEDAIYLCASCSIKEDPQ